MLIDTDLKTVIFPGYTKLTLAQLWSLIELMDDEVDTDEDVLAKLAEQTRRVAVVRKIFTVESDVRDYLYCVVHFEDGHWACSCPDWIHRRSTVKGSACKHIARLYWR